MISCTANDTSDLPEFWEYAPGRWISFNENFELEWMNDQFDIDNFSVHRISTKLKEIEIKEINLLIQKKHRKWLIKKEMKLKKRLNFKDKISNIKPIEQTNHRDTLELKPVFGEYYLYQVRALKDIYSSSPAELSVILIKK